MSTAPASAGATRRAPISMRPQSLAAPARLASAGRCSSRPAPICVTSRGCGAVVGGRQAGHSGCCTARAQRSAAHLHRPPRRQRDEHHARDADQRHPASTDGGARHPGKKCAAGSARPIPAGAGQMADIWRSFGWRFRLTCTWSTRVLAPTAPTAVPPGAPPPASPCPGAGAQLARRLTHPSSV